MKSSFENAGNSGGKMRVAYFDDQLLFREALTRVLEDAGSVSVVCGSNHASHDIRTLLDAQISTVLVALDAQTKDPMITVRQVRQYAPDLPICALVAIDRLNSTREALAAGCTGAVSTSATLSMLIAALESLARGQAFVDPMLGGRLISSGVSRAVSGRTNKGEPSGSNLNGLEVSKISSGKRFS